jgi:hypothetical protein
MRHLDIAQLRSDQRIVTQTIALDLFGSGKAGIAYRSNLTSAPCVAIFEGRTTPTPWGAAQTIEKNDIDLVAIAKQFGIDVE